MEGEYAACRSWPEHRRRLRGRVCRRLFRASNGRASGSPPPGEVGTAVYSARAIYSALDEAASAVNRGTDEQAIREYIKNQEQEDMRLEKPPQPSTVGRDEQAIREYIKNQEQEDMRLEQMMNLWR
jgi:hypothetical protein